MATNIGPKISIEGEKEYQDALKLIIQQAKTLDSEMRVVTSAFDANTSAQEKAEKQSGIFEKQIENQKERIKLLGEQLEKSAEAYDKNDTRTLKFQEQLNKATAALTNMEKGLQNVAEEAEKDALNKIIQQAKTLDSEMKAVTSAFDANTSAQEKAEKQGGILEKQIENQHTQLKLLNDQLQKTVQKYGDNSEQALKMREQIGKTTVELTKFIKEESQLSSALEKELEGWSDAEDAADDYGEEIRDAGKQTENAGKQAEKSGDGWKKLGNILKTSAKAIAAAGAAIGAAAIALGKNVVESFGELEQNLGGSEAVFGQYAKSLQRTAEDAYKNMGASQSDYLATANKMGALFQGSGIEQQRSLELTTQAMQRATDMASVMGIDVESALEAVTGAAKGNYTMMDNLGVAMNVTTLEAYAAAKGFEATWKEMSNAEKAEVAMQYFFEKTAQYEGNFARESTETITGSFGLLKAALQSWSAGLGNKDANVEKLTLNVTDAFSAVIKNITPIAENIIRVLPTALAALTPAITGMLPQLIETAGDLFGQFVDFVAAQIPLLVPVAVEAVLTLADGLISALPELIPAAVSAIQTLADGLIEMLPMLAQAAIDIVIGLSDGIAQSLPVLIPAAAECLLTIADGLIDHIDMLIDASVALIMALADGLIEALPKLLGRLPEILVKMQVAITKNAFLLIPAAFELIFKLAEGIVLAIPELLKSIPKVFQAVKDGFAKMDWIKIGKDLVDGIISGVKSMWSACGKVINDLGSSLYNGVKDFFGIRSPSKLFADEIGAWLPPGIVDGVEDAMPQALRRMNGAMKGFSDVRIASPSMALGSVQSAGATQNSRTQNSYLGGVNVHVYGAQGQDENKLAQIVMEKIESAISRKGAVFA